MILSHVPRKDRCKEIPQRPKREAGRIWVGTTGRKDQADRIWRHGTEGQRRER